ncbi:hypothetical protein Golob_025093, partial [Gossypium lobatum]|nr:hypothetical protein [Gossypium lobatum]
MRVALANVWHALDGVLISDLKEKHLLFWFYNEIYIDRVVEGIVDFPSWLVSKLMSKQFKNFIGEFFAHDMKS